MSFGLDDTIAAIATAPGESGIGIIRISGKEALTIADRIFLAKNSCKPSQCKGYTIHYGTLINPDDRAAIDEVLLTIMRSPKSYTKEDTVEINCHGGITAVREALQVVLENGCRLAEPGEFTKRAFLNGRLDLSQAEAVLDIVRAKTDAALQIGLRQLEGGLSRQITSIRKDFLDILSQLEARIDFPEDTPEISEEKESIRQLGQLKQRLEALLHETNRGRIYREGIHAVICGKPNTGKSSLLNALVKRERSIVTPIAGTTRDTIEELIDIQGIPVNIIDTAGVLKPRNLVEAKAVKRAKQHIDSADLVVILFDGSRQLSQEDRALIKKVQSKKHVIAVINKIDLRQKIDRAMLARKFSKVIEISAKKLTGIGLLEDAVVQTVLKGNMSQPESILMSNERHIQSLRKALKLLQETIDSCTSRLPIEFIAQNIKDVLACFDSILGKHFSEDLLDKIFSEFCIGK